MKNRVIFQLHSFLPGIGSLLLLLVLAGGCQMEGTTGPGNIIEGTFSDGWDAAWNRWPITLLWALVFSVGAGAARRA